jgi:hypothetical protein
VFVLAVMLGVETQHHIGALATTGFGAKASARKQQCRVASPATAEIHMRRPFLGTASVMRAMLRDRFG